MEGRLPNLSIAGHLPFRHPSSITWRYPQQHSSTLQAYTHSGLSTWSFVLYDYHVQRCGASAPRHMVANRRQLRSRRTAYALRNGCSRRSLQYTRRRAPQYLCHCDASYERPRHSASIHPEQDECAEGEHTREHVEYPSLLGLVSMRERIAEGQEHETNEEVCHPCKNGEHSTRVAESGNSYNSGTAPRRRAPRQPGIVNAIISIAVVGPAVGVAGTYMMRRDLWNHDERYRADAYGEGPRRDISPRPAVKG